MIIVMEVYRWQQNKPGKKVVMMITRKTAGKITILANSLIPLIPYSSRHKDGLSLEKIARMTNSLEYYPSKAGNRQKGWETYLQNLFRYHKRKPKTVIIRIVEEAVEWMSNKSEPLTEEIRAEIADAMQALGFSVRKELMAIVQPELKPASIPPDDLRNYFDRLQLHPSLQGDVKDKYLHGHVNEAVRRAAELFEDQVKTCSGLRAFGVNLMDQAFSETNPLISIYDISDPDKQREQLSFKELCKGSMRAFRNPLSHGDAPIMGFLNAFKLLCLFSYLMEAMDQATNL